MKTQQGSGSQVTREKILEVATDLFVEYGYDGTPLSLIASKLEFTKAALYYHFKSKTDILTEILEPLLGQVDELLERAPERFPTSDQRWDFMVRYSQILLSHARAVSVLSLGGNHSWMPAAILRRIERHKNRTTELAMLPSMSEEDQVKAILLTDMLHREIVFESGRPTVAGMSPERRREIVYDFIREALG